LNCNCLEALRKQQSYRLYRLFRSVRNLGRMRFVDLEKVPPIRPENIVLIVLK